MNKMKSLPKINLGTDGWRGVIDKDVTNKTMAEVAQAFAEYLIVYSKIREPIKVVIGFDGRLKSKPFATLFARVLSGNNIISYLSDRTVPTPIVSYYIKANKLAAGVMITASHNPANYNGVKFKASYGGPFFRQEALKIEAMMSSELVQADDENIYQVDLGSVYFEQLESYIDFQTIKSAGLNILIDSMSGAGQQIIENLFIKHEISCKTIYKLAEKDFSGRSAEPIEQNLQPLKEELQKDNYSLGIATDGDADRLGVMMENGEWLTVQETILLLTDYIINHKKTIGHIVKTSSVTGKLRSFFETSERKVFEVQVGFNHICKKMISEDIAFGSEESGGYGFKDHIPDRDGILSGLLITEMLAKSGYKKLSEYAEAKRKIFGNIFYNKIDINYEKEDRFEILSKLYKEPPVQINGFSINSFQEYYSSKNLINGLKFTLEGDNRWLLIRASETEPLIRIYSEGDSNKEAEELINAGREIFNFSL